MSLPRSEGSLPVVEVVTVFFVHRASGYTEPWTLRSCRQRPVTERRTFLKTSRSIPAVHSSTRGGLMSGSIREGGDGERSISVKQRPAGPHFSPAGAGREGT